MNEKRWGPGDPVDWERPGELWTSGGLHSFVVETTGVDERTWLHVTGHPHSVNMRIVERYKRVDRNTLDVSITMTDPAIYTAPIVTTHHFKWIPKQELEEQICSASEAIQYYQIMAAPAGDGSGK